MLAVHMTIEKAVLLKLCAFRAEFAGVLQIFSTVDQQHQQLLVLAFLFLLGRAKPLKNTIGASGKLFLAKTVGCQT